MLKTKRANAGALHAAGRPIDRPIVFVWDHFGPVHIDRCNALRARWAQGRRVIGIEFVTKSQAYDWTPDNTPEFQLVTLFPNEVGGRQSIFRRLWRLTKQCFELGGRDYFFCHYSDPATLITAILLRISGRRVFVMNDSKFDDYERHLSREFMKCIFYLPYNGGLAASYRTKDYMRFLGVPQNQIVLGYNTLSIDRIRAHADLAPAPDGAPFEARHFAVVARFVAKKNLMMALEAYRLYLDRGGKPRGLHLAGSGELEGQLKQHASDLGISDQVWFDGFLSTAGVAKVLQNAVALILPSLEEQFGLVVIEAQAMGLPVILSDNCGARDLHVRSGVNGFVIEPDNPAGLAFFMNLISNDEALWRRMSHEALRRSLTGDVASFANAVAELVGG